MISCRKPKTKTESDGSHLSILFDILGSGNSSSPTINSVTERPGKTNVKVRQMGHCVMVSLGVNP